MQIPSFLAKFVGQRGRQIANVGTWSLVAKFAAALNLLLAVPVVLGQLGAQKFGVWATLVSLFGAAGLLDFGFGNGALNLVATASGRADARRINEVVLQSYRSIIPVLVVLLGIFAIGLFSVPWSRMLGVHGGLDPEVMDAVALVMIAVVLSVPLGLANRIQLGLGSGDVAFQWQAFGSLLSLSSVWITCSMGGGLQATMAASVISPLVASAGNTFFLLKGRNLAWKSFCSHGGRSTRSEIRNEGFLFFILQVAALLAFSSDLSIVSSSLGAEAAGRYAVVQRVFSVVPMLLAFLWVPLWPAYRHALAIGDHGWVSRTLAKSAVGGGLVAGGFGLVILFGFEMLASTWLGVRVDVPTGLMLGFVCWVVLEALGNAFAAFLNAASIVAYQVVTAMVFAVACFAAKLWIVRTIGLSALPWATCVTYFCASLLPTLMLRRRLMSTAFSRAY